MTPPTTPIRISTGATQVIPELDGVTLTAEERPDRLIRWLRFDALVLFGLAGVWAMLTHRDWLRAVDTIVAVLALLEYFRLRFTRGN